MDYNLALNQLTASDSGYGHLKMMIGAHTFVKGVEKPPESDYKMPFVAFKFKASKKYNYCKIFYDAARDLYVLLIAKLTGITQYAKTGKMFVRSKHWNTVYDDMLKEIFEAETGLYVKL